MIPARESASGIMMNNVKTVHIKTLIFIIACLSSGVFVLFIENQVPIIPPAIPARDPIIPPINPGLFQSIIFLLNQQINIITVNPFPDLLRLPHMIYQSIFFPISTLKLFFALDFSLQFCGGRSSSSTLRVSIASGVSNASLSLPMKNFISFF